MLTPHTTLRWGWVPIVACQLWCWGATTSRAAQPLDDTARSAAFLLRSCATFQRNSRSHLMLQTVRRLRDPALEPFFHHLIQSEHPALMIHGLLGLAECSADHKLDLMRVTAVKDPAVQAQVISAAIDDQLLDNEQASQVLTWPGVDTAVKVIVAAQLVKDRQFSDLDLLEEAARSDNPARRGLSALLQLQLGQSGAMDVLYDLDRSDDPRRDQVRQMLLETALRYELDRVGPWAAGIATQPDVDRSLGLLALRVAMRFASPHAISAWQQRFASTTDQAQRTRLSLLALAVAPWLDPGLFVPLTSDRDPLVGRVGQAGLAIASNQGIDTALINLIEMHHPLANRSALNYARTHASDNTAQIILLGLIMAFQDTPPNQRARLLGDVVLATRLLHDRYPQTAVSLLQPLLADAKTDPALAQAILLGLLGCREPHPDRVIAGLEAMESPQANNLAVVLLAKNGRHLTPQQNERLKLLVRGGGDIGQTVRLQAAWAYLKRTNQSQLALATVTDR